MGIDIARPDEDGFWSSRSSTFGLDYSAAAMAQCGGMPQKVLFAGPFPDGLSRCVNPGLVGSGGEFATVTAACIATCGGDSDCQNTARASHKADALFADACSEGGTLRPDFHDPRRLPPPTPVTWTNTVGVNVNGSSLRKTSATPAYDAGAAGSTILAAGADGAFEFVASETDTERAAGFARGPLPDVDPSDDDILYRVVLQKNGVLQISELGAPKFTGTYAAGDTIRLVAAGGVVHYYRNGALLLAGSPLEFSALRVSVSLLDLNATITDARTTF